MEIKKLTRILCVVAGMAVIFGLGGKVYAEEDAERPFFVIFAVKDLRSGTKEPSVEVVKKNLSFILRKNYVEREDGVTAAVSMAPLGIIKKGGTMGIMYDDKKTKPIGQDNISLWSNSEAMSDADTQTFQFLIPDTNTLVVIGVDSVYDKKNDAQRGYIGIVLMNPEQVKDEN